ncbi:NAD(P)-dependent dehydrogenase (short-subunit alcohol dehydrogenase family) [Pseudonocardia kunmingensis]|uniref:NAD(P)-dependent dehydrogenase (Short-subunit alcohol dehydrogenase family) n=1 Tax=Pseudonocardia kunmingensis TaxID=630975 RepID=A0A543DZ73_9PSEU|nr:NAD(P)-dependent dehydrogenase (short-subunit alcohol dehydrogenase family) [Pseudonocardia kunmingensis]
MPDTSFDGRVAVITGAGSGIGAATARLLSASGADVVVVDVDEDAARGTAADLPGRAIAVTADVSREEDVDRYLEAAVEQFGAVHLHHLNAGIGGSTAAPPDLEVADFDRVMAVNLRGPFLGLRAAFRQYRRQGCGGAIVITSSIAGLRGSHDLLPYQISKHGLLGAVRGAAVYGGPRGVRVNAVAPGLVPTGLASAPAAAQDMRRRGGTVPQRRTGTPEEVADAVAYLLGDAASYVNGAVLSVDGGAAAVSTVRASGGAGAWDPADVDDPVGWSGPVGRRRRARVGSARGYAVAVRGLPDLSPRPATGTGRAAAGSPRRGGWPPGGCAAPVWPSGAPPTGPRPARPVGRAPRRPARAPR